jgi:transcriptional regulator with XRE-family HTH domain
MKYPDTDEFLEQLGIRIRALRKEKKLSQRQLGIEALIEKSTIQRIERGLMNCTVKTLLKIANALNIEYAELFNFTAETPSKK